MQLWSAIPDKKIHEPRNGVTEASPGKGSPGRDNAALGKEDLAGIAELWSNACRKKWIRPEELIRKVKEIRERGATIATLNGSFDLMHAGHLQIIYEASLQADVLIVALNTDSSIKAYKSPDRPIIPLEYRAQMMAALEFVDYVTWFDETDPLRLLNDIKPDVHANGAEYGKNCIEATIVEENGGKIHIVPLVPGLSTSSILKKIESLISQGK